MKKSTAIFAIVITAILTGIAVFFVSNQYAFEVNDRVIVSAAEYQQLKGYEKRFQKLLTIEERIKAEFYKDVNDVNFDEALYRGLFKGLDDPYSEYLNEKDFETYKKGMSGEFTGIGVYIDIQDPSGLLTVIEPIEGTPAQAAGLLPGDKILKVDGVSYTNQDSTKAIDHIRGPAGTTVEITLLRDKKEMNIVLERAPVKSPSVRAEMKENNIGYLRIVEFRDNTYEEFKGKLDELLGKGMKSLVIDLRNNPGGLLTEVNKIADRLLGEQVIETIQNREGVEQIHRSDAANKLDMPMVVLVNKYSASASEILTGAIKDSKSGVILGEKTFGKGVVQTFRPLGDGTYYKLTTAYYLTPSGHNIHQQGIEPDVSLEAIKEKGYVVDDRKNDGVLKYAIDFLKK